MTDQNMRYYRPNEDLSFQPVSEDEERALFTASRGGDMVAREKIIRNHLLFAANEARKQVRGRIPDNDVVSAANLALMKAVDKFDPARGNRFTAYLRPFIRGEISALWKSQNLVSNYQKPDEVDTANALPPLEPRTDDHPAEEDDFHAFLKAALTRCRAALSAREQEILTLVYEKEMNFAEIARIRGVSREAIRVNHKRALAKLKNAMLRRANRPT